MNRILYRKLPLDGDARLTMAHWHAAVYFKAAVRGMLIRSALKDAWGLQMHEGGSGGPMIHTSLAA